MSCSGGAFSDEYFTGISVVCGNQLLKRSVRVGDRKSEYVNVSDGVRRTVGIPAIYDKTVYLIGASQIFGSCTEDSHTIASFLQTLCNASPGERVRVINLGVPAQRTPNALLCVMSEKIAKNDAIIYFPPSWMLPFDGDDGIADDLRYYTVMREFCAQAGASFHIAFLPSLLRIENPSVREQLMRAVMLHAKDVFKKIKTAREGFAKHCDQLSEKKFSFFRLDGIAGRPHCMSEIFWDPAHFNYRANQAIAREVHAHIKRPTPIKKYGVTDEEMKSVADSAIRYLGTVAINNYSRNDDIAQWLRGARNPQFDKYDSIGAIVMNCNPFTLGHRHLIESAAKMVGGLYIFVVEEDKSFFPFADRLSLVRRGVEGVDGAIHVLPSGKYIISSFGFPGYFAKKNAITPADSTTDVAIFGSVIAPALGITHRFVGEEPNCLTTNEYNETMKFLLPVLGVKMHVIPRKNESGEPISATTVRNCLRNNDFERIEKLVPVVTYEYLKALDLSCIREA